MIIWIASYPKSGNTYLRSFLCSYYFSENGKFDFNLLDNIKNFPGIHYSKNKTDSNQEASRNWIINQNYFFDKAKLNFLKTHNSMQLFEGNRFTSKDQTIGAIYIYRDPRNIITSLKNHYSMNYQSAFEFMIDDKSFIIQDSYDNDKSNFTYLGSWVNHYKSWFSTKNFKVMLIKYEDLQDRKFEIFIDVVKFINSLSDKDEKVNENKLEKSIKSTNFSVLKNNEKNYGFVESVKSKISGQKINFFNLGFNNRWKKILPKDFQISMSDYFKEDLKFLKY
ncbi:MAG: sulfotransferase domain-containing protein [Candidatus Pelagibacter sp.]